METFSVLLSLIREFIGHQWIPPQRASDVDLWFIFAIVVKKKNLVEYDTTVESFAAIVMSL